MNTLEFLSHLRQLDIELEPHGERLRITAPAKAMTPALRNQLRERKADLLIFLRQAGGLDMPQRLARNEETGLPFTPPPISFSQQTWQFVDSLSNTQRAGSQAKRANNLQAAWLLRGYLDVTQLEEAIEQIVRRHELLRTTFFEHNGQSYQQIKPASDFDTTVRLVQIDLQHLSEEEGLRQVQWMASEEARYAFDTQRAGSLQSEALFRPVLLQISKEKAVFLLTVERCIADHRSLDLFMRDMMQFYSGEEPKALPLQYADVAQWQRDALTDEILKNSLSYWQEQLANLPPVGKLKLPHDHARPAHPSQEGSRETFHLSRELTQKLKRLSQESGATLIMTLLAAFNALLYRYTINTQRAGSEQEDIVIGIPVSLRHRGQSEALIGNFQNMLMLRSKLAASLTFSDLLKQVRQNALDAYTHQEVPFYKVVEALQAQEKAPLFLATQAWRVIFEWEQKVARHASVARQLSAPGLSIQPFDLEKISTLSDLALKIEERESVLVGSFEYSTDLFERATIQRIKSHFISLLKGAVANPQQAISKLPLLPFEEQYKLLVEWNQTEVPYRRDATIHDIFEESAEALPYKTAITFGNQSLTYQELNQQANQLAHHLRQQWGVGPDILVGICMERSLPMAIAILGILKAGGAYVPLDPSYPQERLSFMIEDAQLSFLLMQEQFLGLIPGTNRLGLTETLYSTSGKRYLAPLTICIDRDWPKIAQESKDTPITSVTAHHLAMVIYTSHATGNPKGILIEHQGLVNHTTAIANLYDLAAADRVLQFAPLSTDVAAQEFFASWLSRATVILPPAGSTASATRRARCKRFTTFIQKEELTVLNLPATDWHEWVHHLLESKQALPPSLRLMVIAHEEAASGAYADWLAIPGSDKVRCLNTYGTSETTIAATVYEDSRAMKSPTDNTALAPSLPPTDSRTMPIGRPIANTKLYILDKQLQPVPIGVPGELYIAGEGLARGYLRDLSLTNERFIANPFGSGRLYKTGDLARYLPDGNIEHLEALEHHVKMRGVHIELGEIEARLLEHPIVREGVVIARQRETCKELVAYFTPTQGGLPTEKQWQTFFSQKLPQIMVPSVVVAIENLPRLANGNVDYQALAAPTSAATDNLIVPRTPIQHQLVEIWREVLQSNQPDGNFEQISIHDNFFAVGGSYLLATQVLSRLHQTFQVQFSLGNLFEAPTIAELAEQIETIQWATQSVPMDDQDLSMDNREEFDL